MSLNRHFLRFSIRDQTIFFTRLAMILRSGVPLGNGLQMLEHKNNSRSQKHILRSVIADVARGKTFSSACLPFTAIVGSFSINMIRVGEASGTLHQNLLYLSEELKKKEALKKKVLSALIYPAVIILATVGISGVLTVYIFPKIMPIFASFKEQLPPTTRALIALSQFLIHDSVLLLVSLCAIALAFFFLLRLPRFKYEVDRAVLALPIFGKLSQYYNVVNSMRTMSLLLKGDVRIVQALEIVSRSSENSLYRRCLESVTSEVAQGKRLSEQLENNTRLFPQLLTQMIAVGETTGDLSASLMYVSDMYEEELNDVTRNLTVLLEPILMVVMGLIVGFIAISIIAPIYGITQNLTLH